MGILKPIWHEFIHGGHLVALGSVIIVVIFLIIEKLPLNLFLLIGIYLITYLIHLIDRFADISKDSSGERIEHFQNYRGKIAFVITLSFLGIVGVFANKGPATVLVAILLFSLGLLYGIFFKKLTRYIVGFKSYYTSLAFASVIFFAAYYYRIEFSFAMLYLYLFFVFRWFCNTTFCDIKDIKQDKLENLKTFAVVMDKRKLYYFFNIINLISVIPLIVAVYQKILPSYSLILGFTIFYYFYYLSLSKKSHANYQGLANIWADGESIVWLGLFILGRNLWAL